MSNERKLQLRKIYSILLTCAILAAGLCLMGGCLYIYVTGGPQPFTPEAVANVSSKISWVIWLCVGLTLGSFFLPAPKEKLSVRQKMVLPRSQNRKKLAIIQGTVLALGLLCVVLGVYFDGVQAVVANAIALCMSCIGLG